MHTALQSALGPHAPSRPPPCNRSAPHAHAQHHKLLQRARSCRSVAPRAGRWGGPPGGPEEASLELKELEAAFVELSPGEQQVVLDGMDEEYAALMQNRKQLSQTKMTRSRDAAESTSTSVKEGDPEEDSRREAFICQVTAEVIRKQLGPAYAALIPKLLGVRGIAGRGMGRVELNRRFRSLTAEQRRKVPMLMKCLSSLEKDMKGPNHEVLWQTPVFRMALCRVVRLADEKGLPVPHLWSSVRQRAPPLEEVAGEELNVDSGASRTFEEERGAEDASPSYNDSRSFVRGDSSLYSSNGSSSRSSSSSSSSNGNSGGGDMPGRGFGNTFGVGGMPTADELKATARTVAEASGLPEETVQPMLDSFTENFSRYMEGGGGSEEEVLRATTKAAVAISGLPEERVRSIVDSFAANVARYTMGNGWAQEELLGGSKEMLAIKKLALDMKAHVFRGAEEGESQDGPKSGAATSDADGTASADADTDADDDGDDAERLASINQQIYAIAEQADTMQDPAALSVLDYMSSSMMFNSRDENDDNGDDDNGSSNAQLSSDPDDVLRLCQFIAASENYAALLVFVRGLAERKHTELPQIPLLLEEMEANERTWWFKVPMDGEMEEDVQAAMQADPDGSIVDQERVDYMSQLDALLLRFLSELDEANYSDDVLMKWSMHPHIGPRIRSGSLLPDASSVSGLVLEALQAAGAGFDSNR